MSRSLQAARQARDTLQRALLQALVKVREAVKRQYRGAARRELRRDCGAGEHLDDDRPELLLHRAQVVLRLREADPQAFARAGLRTGTFRHLARLVRDLTTTRQRVLALTKQHTGER